ncbi:DUF2235 domain-containing protein [Arvimicrobium flavum]|uniref:DUF2235 domain-containing protein n=1 Tax=Arvimicrobium flavum TaxID=3393320 RepID=UPI00237C19C2|nr:DUF2235 domain-containing protein [Mesorhizobium shangrilense]
MPKNIVICSDGTGQAGGLRPDQNLSNVYKLYRAVRSGPDSGISPARQVAYYDAGLGSGEVETAWSRLRKAWSSATGTGFTRNVADCYEAILRHYEPGDLIFLFGFSRGAYTVRSVAGVLNLCGVPTRMPDGSAIPRYGAACRAIAEEAVHRVYEHGAGRPRREFEEEREEKARRFRDKYGSVSEHPKRGNVAPYFIGVFDTVAALGVSGFKRLAYLTGLLGVGAGLPFALSFVLGWMTGWSTLCIFLALLLGAGVAAGLYALKHRIKFIRDFPNKGDFRWHWSSWKFAHYDRFLDPRVRYARHALAIDEDRATFDRVPWAGAKDQPERTKTEPKWLIQMWFAGNHSDIGGSYPEDESRLSDIALEWMVEQATGADPPLIIDRNKLHLYPDPTAMQHCEIERGFEMYPRWWPMRLRRSWNRQRRSFSREFVQHPSVKARIDAGEVSKMGLRMKYDPYADRPA